jgi:alpha-amylase/alpha-mannosidase (GH57 family)
MLDHQGRIVRISNNYANISFNFGPTVLSWFQYNAPDVLARIVKADFESRLRFSNHGSALAQAYNHMILPLANERDKRTQVRWGIADFRYRFGREPEGMWLPETAADVATLEVLAASGIKFTILAPHQCARVREMGSPEWTEVGGGRIDPTRAYRAPLPSGRSIDLFFYDGPVSRAVAFEGLLNNGETFANRIAGLFSDARDWPQLAHIATDGESYGHHHRYGEMALAYALDHIETRKLAKLTNYGEFLEKHPPRHEVEIIENTAWSCAHGLERWCGDCGCNSGAHLGWNQQWRLPLRLAFDWLRDRMAPLYEEAASEFLHDPWIARDEYISVILDRTPENRQCFLERQALRELSQEERIAVWKLLELQRHALLMYTSCGWFFDDLSGIETVQVIRYAGRVVQLARELFSEPVEEPFLDRLAQAHSNLPEHTNAARIYENFVRPALVDLKAVGAHYGISSLFEPYPEQVRVYCYTAERQHYQSMEAGKLRLAVGRARITSEVTGESDVLSFGVLHFGDHNLNGAVRRYRGSEQYSALVRDARDAFYRADIPEVIRVLDRGFGGDTYSLKSLFRDEQRRILDDILNSTLGEAEAMYRQVYEHHAALLRYLASLNVRPPKALRAAADYALNSKLRLAFSEDALDTDRIRRLFEEARLGSAELDNTTLEYAYRRKLESLADRFAEDPDDMDALNRAAAAASLLPDLPFHVTLWNVQNTVYTMAQLSANRSTEWNRAFATLTDSLWLRLNL